MPNVMVFPCGSEIGLEIHNSLRYAKDVRLVGVSSVPDHGRYVFRRYEQIGSSVGDSKLFDELRAIISRWSIDFIFPAHDTVIEALSPLTPDDLGGAQVIGSNARTNVITRYKSKTYRALSGFDFIPTVFEPDTVKVTDFPIFVKPDGGFGSRGIAIAQDPGELERLLADDPQRIAVEFLPGPELTVDCFTDRHRRLLFVGARTRDRIRNGISVHSEAIEATGEVRAIAAAINDTIELRGPWFFQVKQAGDGRLKLLEVAPRIAGTMNLYRNRGVNFSLLGIHDRMGADVSTLDTGYPANVDRALVNRHQLGLEYRAVYVDLDDTLVVNGQVNVWLLALLHQARSAGKEIILLTRHALDVDATLDRWAISPRLFTRIVHVTDGSPKSRYVETPDAVFIDDSFREREDVRRAVGAAVFDVDAVESLLDWRM